MIEINKGKETNFLSSRDVQLAIEKMNDFYSSKNRSQKRYDFPFLKEIDSKLKPIYSDLFHRKCGYCESKIEHLNLGTIDRFRPYNGVRDENEYFEDLYWWLTYDSENLVYSCKECSQYKANYFPIQGARLASKAEILLNEEPLLLNPFQDIIEKHLKIGDEGALEYVTKKGLQTIELLRLNRNSLIEKRRNAAIEIKIIFDSLILNDKETRISDIRYLNRIYKKDLDIEFLFFKYYYLLFELKNNPTVGEHIDGYNDGSIKEISKDELSNEEEIVKSDFFPIEYIEIKNFKCISNLKIIFPSNEVENRSWVAFLGENGLGKSSILQAICLGLSPGMIEKEKIGKLIKKNEREAEIKIKERDSNNLITTIIKKRYNDVDIDIVHSGEFSSSLIGYGSVRLLPNHKQKSQHSQNRIKYRNLFDHYEPIDDIFSWLNSLYLEDKKQFDSIAYSLKQLLPNELSEELTFLDGELMLKESKIPYFSMSDGYKSTISLALDIMKTLSDGTADMDKLSGIVLIDELGNQLHPRWQMQVVHQFRKVFPKINFIISTHHPLCLRGLEKDEVMILKKDIDEEISLINDLPDPSLLRVDQILSSPYFGLHSAVDPEIEALFDEYYSLLAKENLTIEEENRKLELSDKMPKLKFLGDSLREELAIYVIDELLAKKVRGKSENLDLEDLKEEAKQRVKSIWDNLNHNEEQI